MDTLCSFALRATSASASSRLVSRSFSYATVGEKLSKWNRSLSLISTLTALCKEVDTAVNSSISCWNTRESSLINSLTIVHHTNSWDSLQSTSGWLNMWLKTTITLCSMSILKTLSFSRAYPVANGIQWQQKTIRPLAIQCCSRGLVHSGQVSTHWQIPNTRLSAMVGLRNHSILRTQD